MVSRKDLLDLRLAPARVAARLAPAGMVPAQVAARPSGFTFDFDFVGFGFVFEFVFRFGFSAFGPLISVPCILLPWISVLLISVPSVLVLSISPSI